MTSAPLNDASALHVLHVVPGLTPGGAERFLERLVASLPRFSPRAIRTTVVSLNGTFELGPTLIDAGATVIALERGHKDGFRDVASRVAQVARQVAQTKPPDVVQGWMQTGNLAASALGAVTRRPTLWNLRVKGEMDVWSKKSRVAHRIAHHIPSPSSIICVSQGTLEWHAHTGFDRAIMQVIENGFDAFAFAPRPEDRAAARRALSLTEDDVVLIAVQRFVDQKNPALLIRAMRRLVALDPRRKLVLAGDGNSFENHAFRALVTDDDRAFLRPLDAIPDVGAVHPAADLFVSVSRAEGLPNALAECVLSGLPAVATDVGDAHRFHGPSVTLIPRDDEDAFVTAVNAMLARDPKARAVAARETRARVQQEFSMERAVRAYVAAWEDADVRHRRRH